MDVKFLFIQAKTSPHFDGHEITAFVQGVRHFFDQSLPKDANEAISNLHQLKQYIYDASIHMTAPPTCQLFYVCTGKWSGDNSLASAAEKSLEDLRSTNLFSSAQFNPIDGVGLKRLYRNLKQKITREIVFERHTILPPITGVQEAYIGILPSLEYLKLIEDDDGDLNKRLFYDNVRDFQGYNTVNQEIEATIHDAERSDRFLLLNNGVTIVARDATKVGAKFKLSDYQIVNGCQTSHVLFSNRQSLTGNVYLPVKLIVTSDPEVTNQVIQGTNRQTEVKLEALQSLAPFHKTLEEFYLAISRTKPSKLYYERRSKQYEHLGIAKKAIITLAVQTQCFVAMFLNEPHSTHRYYGELLRSYSDRMFGESHLPTPYFLSGLTLVTLGKLFATGELPRELRLFKFHLLMLFRLLLESEPVPPLNSRKMESYCQAIIGVLDDGVKAKSIFVKAVNIVVGALRKTPRGREQRQRTKAFTTALIEACGGKWPVRNADVERRRGRVKWFSEIKGYGFIASESGEELFVHYSAITAKGYRMLQPDEPVEFASVTTEKGLPARDVRILD